MPAAPALLAPAPRASRDPASLLEGCLTWTAEVVQGARLVPSTTPTPCRAWDLRRLLVHLADSLAALGEAALLGRVDTEPPAPPAPPEPQDRTAPLDALVDTVVRRCRLLGAAFDDATAGAGAGDVAVADLSLPFATLVEAGALEVAVHGWDVARSLGPADLPGHLARPLLPVALALVAPGERGARFAAARPATGSAGPAARLLAHLGRDAGWQPGGVGRSQGRVKDGVGRSRGRGRSGPAAVEPPGGHPAPW